MADNVTVDNGALTDYIASTDEVTIGGVTAQVQRMKLVDGTDGGTGLIGGDAANGLDVDVTRLPSGTNAIGRVGHDKTGIGDGRKVVAAAGTREALVASSTPAKVVFLTAETDNTGVVVVGGTGVIAALATRRGTPLSAGDTVILDCDDLVDINLDVTVAGDGVTYTYLT